MKKLLHVLLCTVLMLAGCSKDEKNTISKEKYEEYQTYYQSVLDAQVFKGSSENYFIAMEMSQIPDGTYRYAVVVDHAQVAMYDVILMVVENDTPFDEADKIMPSLGILEEPSSLIPGQVNMTHGYVKGLAVSGETTDGELDLKMLVQWKSEEGGKTNREFLSYHLSPEGFAHEGD